MGFQLGLADYETAQSREPAFVAAPTTDRIDDRVGVVPRICDESFAGRVLDQVLRFRRVVLLAGRGGGA